MPCGSALHRAYGHRCLRQRPLHPDLGPAGEASRYSVSPHSNRIALRINGPALERAVDSELPSEGMVLGAVQVPPDGRPVLFLADSPTTGGYPVIGVVPETALSAAAQAPPGLPVRFVPLRDRRPADCSGSQRSSGGGDRTP
jgi:allophanate hydrolase subunit 2